VLAQSPKPEAHDKVLVNNPDRIGNLEMLVFEEKIKPEFPEKNISEQSREQQQQQQQHLFTPFFYYERYILN